MRIGIDIDDVVAEYSKGYLGFMKEQGLGRAFCGDIFSYDLWEVLGVGKKLGFEMVEKFSLTEGFACLDLVDGAKEGVECLKMKHDIYFITGRSLVTLKKTRDFIFSNFGILGNRIIFSGEIFNKQNKTKDEICEELGIDLIIEDNVKFSLGYARNGLRVLLMDKPWNKEGAHDNILRCKDWDDVLEKVEGMEE